MSIWPTHTKTEIKLVSKILQSGNTNILLGKYNSLFEKQFSKKFKANYCCTVSNGTIALELALKSLKLNKNSEVIVTPRSFASSAYTTLSIGALPVFADIDLKTQNIELENIKEKFNNKTKAVIVVHLAGYPCKIDLIANFCKRNNISLIEDCSQAHGAKYKNKYVGTYGDIGIWSFCSDKIISTGGEGGMIASNKKNIIDYCISYRNHGVNPKKNKSRGSKFIYSKDSLGSNYRITEIQAAIGYSQLKLLDERIFERQKRAKIYEKFINNYTQLFYYTKVNTKIHASYYRFYIFINKNIKNRKKIRYNLVANMRERGIECDVGSCPEIYKEKIFKRQKKYSKISLENAKILGETSISFKVDHTIPISKIYKNLKIMKIIFNKCLK